MNVTPIANPLPGEHLAGTSPVLQPETDAGWQQRLNFWAGRALTAEALELEQENRAARLATWGRVSTSGIVAGLEVALEAPTGGGALRPRNHFLHVQPGHGISATGEDVVVPRPLRVPLDDIEVQLARFTELEKLPASEKVDMLIDLGGSRLRVHPFNKNYIPWAAVLVLRPTEVRQFGKLDPADPCELDPSRDPFADERRQDAALFRLVVLPSNLRHHPLLTGAAVDSPLWRNRLAHVIFSTEAAGSPRQYLRYFRSKHAKDRWETLLAAGVISPWEMLGVPLALFGAERVPATAKRRYFLDRAAVARPGGRSRPRTRLAARMATGDTGLTRPAGNGTPALWRARVDQFAEHLSALETAVPAEQAESFQFLPPAGLLPRAALDFLTTAQALMPPPPVGVVPDRAAVSHFFPADYLIEAVPTVLEDLDAALAASAPMDPFDFEQTDLVRVLVPVPQRAFDPRLLVVELEDPLFRAELARLYALRQDWRQRRYYVLGRSEDLQRLIRGGPLRPRLDPAQTEPEPVETKSIVGLPCALIPPRADGPWTLPIDFDEPPLAGGLETLRVRMHFDEEQPPVSVELRWRVAATGREVSDVWNVMPPLTVADSALEPNGLAVAASLWRVFSKSPAELGLTAQEKIAGVKVILSGGRAAIGHVMARDKGASSDFTLFRPERPATETKLPSHGWASVSNALLRAPFEGRYKPVPADGVNFEDHLDALAPLFDEFEEDLLKLDPRLRDPLHIQSVGLERLLALVERETNKADETVDLAFERVQAHLQRVRAVMLGEDEAEEAQSSPAVAQLVRAKQARVPAATLGQRMSIDPNLTRKPDVANIKVLPRSVPLTRTATALVKDRKLNFTRRFHYGEVYAAYESLRACLLDTLKSLTHLKVGFDDDDLPEIEEVDPTPGGPPPRAVSFTTLRSAKVDFFLRLNVTNFQQEKDERTVDQSGEILSKAIHRGNVILLLLRKVEEYIERRRELLARGRAALAAARQQVRAADVRIGLLDSRLAEARHDVSVARALRQEERERVGAINDRRDTIVRDEVRFLAYVRPRAVEPVRRASPSWRLEQSGTLAPVPACLQQHDEPPDPLRAYVQLFRHSPVRWFTHIGPRLRELNTKEKLVELLSAARRSALDFTAEKRLAFSSPGFAAATQTVLRSSYSLIEGFRIAGAALQVPRPELRSWEDLRRDAEEHASLRDIIAGRHGNAALARAAADELELIEQVATCLHAEFAAVAPATRLVWVERYSEFDKPSPLRDLTALPRFGSLPRTARRRFQAFVDWLFGRVDLKQREAFNLINDLVRLCLLLASHAPVKKLIAGHVPRPVPARPGALIPIRPINPAQVRVGMEFHVWQASTIVARGRVEDLRDGEVSARVERAQTATTMIDQTMRVQFVAPALGFAMQFAQH
jgi:hypothetical protein